MNFNSQSKSQSGFTLLEVMIAMVILVFIGFGIYQATTGTYRLRDILSNEGDFYNGIRLSMNILDRDIGMIYTPALILPKKDSTTPPDVREMEAIMSSDLGQTTQYWGMGLDKNGVRPSHFIGTDSKMSFIAVSHLRIYKDAPESEFSKIAYELKKDEGNKDNPDTMVLVKSESPNVFEEDDSRDKMMAHYPLLHGIKKLKFRYWRKDKAAYENSWDSDKEDYKNIYPDFVEVTLEVVGPSRLSFEGTYKFRPEIPLRGLDPRT